MQKCYSNNMDTSLRSFTDVLKIYNHPFIASMLPPVNFSNYQEQLEKLYGRKISSSKVSFLKKLYAWSGGSSARLVPGYWYLTTVQQNIHALNGDKDELQYMRLNGFYPIMQSENGRLLCITLFDESVILWVIDFYDIENPNPATSAYDSFESWISFSIYCFEHGIFTMKNWQGQSILWFTEDKMKADLFDKMYFKFNPKHGKLHPPY